MTGSDGLLLPKPAQDLLFRQARSATEFSAEEVSEEQLAAIHDLVRYGPTSFNQQPLRILAIRSPQARQRLLPHLNERNRRRTAAAPLPVVLATDLDFHHRLPEVFPHAPGLAELLEGQPERRLEQARYNAWLQIGYFIIGVRAAGLAAGPMIGFDAEGVDREFFPGTALRSLLVVNLGRPLPRAHARLPRLSYADVVRTL
ncbi:malonic semialdehyde reductase [Crossiella sp. SN42]|uniref:malonic semialdehyde reductase n=1 Tax=Crossiella sp. SN42 TaxID=2944808 RepID=UPI00207C2331|nr:malonic semialdehyde reductase [Crossiella sp. SN42]MCO1580351.1 malonic semialdehyde reductase [Crossiella sp. SN42]